jgi:hypothetical protein
MRVWLALAALVLCACPPPPTDDDGGTMGDTVWPEGTVELGAPVSDTDETFQPLPTAIELHQGAQGGFHAPVLFRVNGQVESAAIFTHRLTRTSDGVLVSKGTRAFDVTGGAWATPSAVPLFLCPTPVGVNIVDQQLTFELTVSRASGVVLGRAKATAVVHCPASAQSFCASICKG